MVRNVRSGGGVWGWAPLVTRSTSTNHFIVIISHLLFFIIITIILMGNNEQVCLCLLWLCSPFILFISIRFQCTDNNSNMVDYLSHSGGTMFINIIMIMFSVELMLMLLLRWWWWWCWLSLATIDHHTPPPAHQSNSTSCDWSVCLTPLWFVLAHWWLQWEWLFNTLIY